MTLRRSNNLRKLFKHNLSRLYPRLLNVISTTVSSDLNSIRNLVIRTLVNLDLNSIRTLANSDFIFMKVSRGLVPDP